MKLTCDIVQDMLPLYEDDVCSQASRDAIDAHVCECEHCRELLGQLRAFSEGEIGELSESEGRAVIRGFKKIRRRWIASVLAVIMLIPVFILAWAEYKDIGVHFTNLRELYIAERFMDRLADGNYREAFRYLETDSKKEAWQEIWFDAETLADFESDALTMFCDMASEFEESGGIAAYRYRGIFESGFYKDTVHRIIYSVTVGEETHELYVDVTDSGVCAFGCEGSFLADPLAKLGMWSEYLWQKYEGCYYDPEAKQYFYYENAE